MLLVLLGVLVVVLVGALITLYLAEKNGKQPTAQRKWTDPKFHD